MSDEALRTLERTARRSCAPDDVLRWAAELDRAGRPDDALAALCLARDAAAVRAAIVSRPPSPGPPLLEGPRERFRVKLAGSDQARLVGAGPLGVVVGSRARTRVLDPDTGETRLTLPGAGWHGLAGDVLLRVLGTPARLEAHDLWTGELLHTTRLAGTVGYTWVGPGLLVSGRMGALQAYAFDGRRPPAPTWRVDLPDHPGPVWLADARLAASIAFGSRLGLIVDVATGRVVREVPNPDGLTFEGRAGWLAAAHGVALGVTALQQTLRAFALADGRELWARERLAGGAVAVAPDLVLVACDGEVLRLAAATGAPAGASARDLQGAVDAILPARGLDYLLQSGHGAVVAWRRDGAVAWRWRPQPSLHLMGSAATLGRLYLVCGRQTVVCLDRRDA